VGSSSGLASLAQLASSGLVLKQAGYAGNFAGSEIGWKKFLGLCGAFGMVLAFWYGLLYTPIRIWTVPLLGGVLALALILRLLKN